MKRVYWSKGMEKDEMVRYMIGYPTFSFWYRLKLRFGSRAYVAKEFDRFVSLMRM